MILYPRFAFSAHRAYPQAVEVKDEAQKQLIMYRWLISIAGTIYLLWWFAVEQILPQAFNPFLSRLAVVLTIFFGLGISFISAAVQRQIRLVFMAATWLITAHYFYLFLNNGSDINWIVGTYITVMAICLGLLTPISLIAYSIFVLLMSVGLVAYVPGLGQSVFFPGLFTILLQAYAGLLFRLRYERKAERERTLAQTMAENVRSRDEFISIASHELKTPLSTLILQSQMLQAEVDSGKLKAEPKDSLKRSLNVLNRQANRLLELVESMLDVSRISTNRLVLNKQPMDLVACVVHTTASLQIHGDQKLPKIDLKSSIPINITADRSRIQQVTENLLTNAIKYGNGLPIEVTVHQVGSNALIKVIDQGIGIAPEFREKIFDRFERAISARNISGLGLGLYITKKIVEAHGGTIRVDSIVGQGSTFIVQLPIGNSS